MIHVYVDFDHLADLAMWEVSWVTLIRSRRIPIPTPTPEHVPPRRDGSMCVLRSAMKSLKPRVTKSSIDLSGEKVQMVRCTHSP